MIGNFLTHAAGTTIADSPRKHTTTFPSACLLFPSSPSILFAVNIVCW